MKGIVRAREYEKLTIERLRSQVDALELNTKEKQTNIIGRRWAHANDGSVSDISLCYDDYFWRARSEEGRRGPDLKAEYPPNWDHSVPAMRGVNEVVRRHP
jgi:hypothetical protein